MPASSLIPMSLEQDLLARKQIAQDQIAQGRNLDLGSIARLTGIQQKWGWLPPSVQLGFAQAGFDHNSPEVGDAAQLELRRRARFQNIVKDLRGINTLDELKHAQDTGELHGLSDQTKKALAQQAITGQLSGGPDFGYSLSRAMHGDIVGAVAGGAHEQATPSDQDTKVGGVNVSEGARALTREVGAAANTGLQSVQGMIRNEVGGGTLLYSNSGQDFTQQTELGQQVNLAQQGKDASLGAGWLPDPNSAPAKAALDVQRQAAPLVAGHAFSLGRATASGVNDLVNATGFHADILEPDHLGWNLISGAVDAGVAMKADPAATLLTTSSEARAASKTFAPEGALDSGSSTLDEAIRATGTDAGPVFRSAKWDALAQSDPKEYLDEIQRQYGRFAADTVRSRYENAGIYVSGRPFLLGKGSTPDVWMDSPIGNTVITRMAEEPSASRLVRDFHIPPTAADGTPIAAPIAGMSDPEEIKQFVRPFLGPDIHGPIQQPGGFTYAVKRGLSNLSPTVDRTLTGMIPDRWVDPQDRANTWKSIDGWLQTSNVPEARRNVLLDRYLNADGPDETFHALAASSDAVKESLLAHGMGEKRANQLSRLFPDAAEQERLYGIDQATRGELDRNSGVVVEGIGHQLPAPLLTTEGLNRGFELPDMREIRRATSQLAPIVDSTPWKVTTGILDSFLSFWRNAHLLRPGLGARIVGDSQLSLAANGYDSLFTHPLNTVSAIIGGSLDKKWAQVAQRIPGVRGSMLFDALDAPMVSGYDDVEQAIHGGWTALEDPTKVALAGFHPVSRGHDQYAQSLADELIRTGGDPRVRGILEQESPQAAKEWLWSGDGASLREKSIPLAKEINAANEAKAAGLGDGAFHIPLDFESRSGSDAFVDDIYNRVHSVTGGDAELRDAILTGKLGDTPIRSGRFGVTNQEALDRIDELSGQGFGPDVVKARDFAHITRSAVERDRALKTKVLRSLFDHMVMLPDADLDRIPAYQQAYWKRAAEYLPYLDTTPVKVGGEMTTLRDLVLQRASENLPESSALSDITGSHSEQFLNNLRNAPVDAGARKLTLDQFHQLTKSAALDEIPRVVHDLSTRSQFFDMTRLLFPFGDAFRRIMQRWVTNAWENPSILRRAEQGITAARQSGFFHVDPTTGQEVFTYTGSSWLTKNLIGQPIPLTGQVGGLSMIGEGLPGVGPAVTIPAQYFLPDTPNLVMDGKVPLLNKSVRDIIFPYGQPEKSPGGLPGEIAASVLPPSVDKIQQGLTGVYHDQKAYNTTVGAMIRYLASTGDYNLHGNDAAAETNRMLSDAKDDAKWSYVIRGMAQTSAPSAPTPDYQVKDKSGHLVIVDKIVNQYRDVQTKKGPDAALDWLVKNYGMKNVFIAQPFSKPIVYGVPVTKEGHDWADTHPDVRDKYPNSYGFFAPQTDAHGKPFKFDITAFEDQFIRKERTSLTADQMVKEGNNRIGMWRYHKMRDAMLAANGGDTIDKSHRALLDDYRTALMKTFPGFNLIPYDDKRLPRTVGELQAATKDPALAHTDAAQGMSDYFRLREQVTQVALARGYKTPFKAKGAADLRDILREAADIIIKQHPDFAPAWEQVLSHEMTTDVKAATP